MTAEHAGAPPIRRHYLIVDERGVIKVECPEVTEECRMWWTCGTCHDLDELPAELRNATGYGPVTVHGVEHQPFDEDDWCVRTDLCHLAEYATQVQDWYDERETKLAPGRYNLDLICWEDTGKPYLRLAD